MCKENDFNYIDVTKDTFSQMYAFIKSTTIESFFDKRSKCILLDNIDVLLQNDKVTINTLLDIVKKCHDKVMVIFTCNSNDEKKIIDIKKNIETVRISYPSPKDAFVYIMNIFSSSDIDFDPTELLSICTKYNGSIREIIEQYVNNCKNEHVSLFKNCNIFEKVQHILKSKISNDDIIYLLDDEVNITTCMKLEEYMFKNYSWALWDIVYGSRLYSINNSLHSINRNANKEYQLRMSQALSKTSHRQILHKKMESVYSGVSNINKLMIANIYTSINKEYEKKEKQTSEFLVMINTYRKYFIDSTQGQKQS